MAVGPGGYFPFNPLLRGKALNSKTEMVGLLASLVPSQDPEVFGELGLVPAAFTTILVPNPLGPFSCCFLLVGSTAVTSYRLWKEKT